MAQASQLPIMVRSPGPFQRLFTCLQVYSRPLGHRSSLPSSINHFYSLSSITTCINMILSTLVLIVLAFAMCQKSEAQFRVGMPSLQDLFQSMAAVWSRWKRLFTFYQDNEQTSPLLALPTELQLLIIAQLLDVSRASLALTCKTQLSLQSSSTPFKPFRLPCEQPSNIQSVPMSKPDTYHPTRWAFLSFLERDLQGTWLRCSECLVLHPEHIFAAYQRSIVPWLAQYYKAKAPEHRTCRHSRSSHCRERNPILGPSGIVDICPCIKLTIAQKLQLEAKLADQAIYPGRMAHSEFESWSHRCRHTYGAVEIDVRLRFFLYGGTWPSSPSGAVLSSSYFSLPDTLILKRASKPGSLGVLLEYRHTYPSRPSTHPKQPPLPAPRLLCPHKNLQGTIENLFFYQIIHQRIYHDPKSKCPQCQHQSEHCLQCMTILHGFRRIEHESAGMTACTYRVERCLDDESWPMQTVFPLARRQTPMTGTGSLAALWFGGRRLY